MLCVMYSKLPELVTIDWLMTVLFENESHEPTILSDLLQTITFVSLLMTSFFTLWYIFCWTVASLIVSIGQHTMTNKIVVKASFPSVEKKPMEDEVEKDTIEPVVADEPCKSGERLQLLVAIWC